jgi:hypothetical protein
MPTYSRKYSAARNASAIHALNAHPLVQDVFEHWRGLYDRAEYEELTDRRREVIEQRLGYPFTVTQLKEALTVVAADPMIIRRRRDYNDITTVLRSDRRVCQALGLVHRKPDDTWLEQFADTWTRCYNRDFWWNTAERLRFPRLIIGEGALHTAFEAYCQRTPWQEARIEVFARQAMSAQGR